MSSQEKASGGPAVKEARAASCSFANQDWDTRSQNQIPHPEAAHPPPLEGSLTDSPSTKNKMRHRQKGHFSGFPSNSKVLSQDAHRYFRMVSFGIVVPPFSSQRRHQYRVGVLPLF